MSAEFFRFSYSHFSPLLDDECAGEDTAMEIELLESRVRAARLAGV